ncbi:ATP-grasp domain-containing protein [Aequorivita capsosiphonis]|uniref:ATP-grasp domain-containing protein n=1 Tax=Aequorivita capsosiphonis TaxID=487317 RepID=UPI0004012BB1|nr:ATP-grasp domain-containing protein [Aequorivita capsosiphonis]
MKKILLLGGLRYLIPIIKSAKKLGYYVITCDNLPNNIAHQYADEFHNVSITDKNAVLHLAKRLEIDGIMSFAVDPGVITAAYISEKLNLPSAGPYKSIELLQNKALFRKFLAQHNFNVPKAKGYNSIVIALDDMRNFDVPLIVKPVDSAGSKGVSKVENFSELEEKFQYALSFSSSKEFIVEEFIEQDGFSSDSDCFSLDGNLIFCSFSNQRFDANAANPYTPSAYSWPSTISSENQIYLKNELQRLIRLLEMKTSIYNIEVRVSKKGVPYIMEVSPRGGGNRLSEILRYATGTNLISCAVQAALGEEIEKIQQPVYNSEWAEIILYSNHSGQFKELKIDATLDKYIVEVDLWVKKGDLVNSFTGANEAIGTLVLQFDSAEQLEKIVSEYSKYIEVIVAPLK